MRGGDDLRALREAATGLAVPVTDHQWSKIHKILELLNKYRLGLNLTGARDWAEVESHAVEAVVAVAAASRAGLSGADWLDVGSGGGLPGLVVGCLWPGPLTLVEPRVRRVAFLELGAAICGSNVVVRRVRLENGVTRILDGGSPLRRDYGVASARAVFAPAQWLQVGRSWLRAGGVCLVHGRADADPIETEAPLITAAWERWAVRAYVSRGTAGRLADVND